MDKIESTIICPSCLENEKTKENKWVNGLWMFFGFVVNDFILNEVF
jgi:hypothetical protein